RGVAKAAKLSTRTAKEGTVCCYIHHSGKVGVLLEVNCITDFVAKNDEFQTFARDIAMHIAATSPQWIKKEDVPQSVIEHELEIYRAKACQEGKPDKILDKIAEGMLKKFYTDNCLLEQPFVRDEEHTIGAILTAAVAKTGENIVISRFSRFAVGEGGAKAEEEAATA
ncbi:MAG: translation elongation factor Ts, partial [Candidatus Sumerlaeota bacterium]|nr:translation elongation factor Ts [Candidatus Sumerlaeota bacterium]